MPVDSFCETYGVKLLDVPADGHCFLSCIRLFFKENLKQLAELTRGKIWNNLWHLNTVVVRNATGHTPMFSLLDRLIEQWNVFQQGRLLDDEQPLTKESFLHDMARYFNNGDYGTQSVDFFIYIRSHVFGINILILNESSTGLLVMPFPRRDFADCGSRLRHDDYTIVQ